MLETRIVPAGPERVPELAALLGHAFADDRISFPFPAGEPYEQTRRMFEIVDLRFAEAGFVWEVPSARGVAMWVGPDDFDRYLRIEKETRYEIETLTDDGGARYRAFWECGSRRRCRTSASGSSTTSRSTGERAGAGSGARSSASVSSARRATA